LRLGTAAIVVLLLAVVQYAAVATTAEAAVKASLVENTAMVERSVVKEKNERQLTPDLVAAEKFEDASDWTKAQAAYAEQERIFPKRPELVEGVSFAGGMAQALGEAAPRERIVALAEAEKHLGQAPERRRLRGEAVTKARNEAVRQWLREAEKLEAVDPEKALNLYNEILVLAPEAQAVVSKTKYLGKVFLGDARLEQSRFAEAAESFVEARNEVREDAKRLGYVDRRLVDLRSDWIAAIAKEDRAVGADEDKWYLSVVGGLEAVVRKLESVGVTRETVFEEFRKVTGR
jgi:tetratricopeptide (TPR) repeat protein